MALIIGTAGDDILNGTEDRDVIRGRAGWDHLYGGGGNDTLWAGEGGGELHGGAGSDELYGDIHDDYLDGGNGQDQLYGGSGADWLVGGAAADYMEGGNGDDTYVVQGEDTLVEVAKGGDRDLVIVEGNWTLAEHFELLELAGTGDFNGFGNDDHNQISGNSGNNHLSGFLGHDGLYGNEGNDVLRGNYGDDYLNGGEGDDRMIGSVGNDQYFVDSLGDVVIELAGEGDFDWLYTRFTTDLNGTNIENVEFDDAGGAIDATGTDGDNWLRGNIHANTMHGGGGDDAVYGGGYGIDYLYGDAGNDNVHGTNGGTGGSYVYGGDGNDRLGGYRDFLFGGDGADTFRIGFFADLHGTTIMDFVSGVDDIDWRIDSESYFHVGAQATSPDHHVIYDPDTGRLYYDYDGSTYSSQSYLATIHLAPGSAMLQWTDFNNDYAF